VPKGAPSKRQAAGVAIGNRQAHGWRTSRQAHRVRYRHGGGSDGFGFDLRDGGRSAAGGSHARGTSQRAADSAHCAPPLGSPLSASPPTRREPHAEFPLPITTRGPGKLRRCFPAAIGDRPSAHRSALHAHVTTGEPIWRGRGCRVRPRRRRQGVAGFRNDRARRAWR